MSTASGLFLTSTAIASFGLGWLLRGLLNQSLDLTKIRSDIDSNIEVPEDAPEKDALGLYGSHLPDSGISARQFAYSLLQQAPVGYLEVDSENLLLWGNTLACQILGIPCDDIYKPATPRLLLELVRSYELDQLIEITRQSQTTAQKDWVLNLVSLDPINPNEGVAYPLRGYGVPLEDNHVGIFLENRQEAETLMQQRDRWTSDVAHELKTPLTSIRLVAETLRNRVDPALTRWLDRLLNEILRLSNLVEDLLNLSRLKRSGGTGITLKPVELTRLLFAAWQSLEPLAQIKQLEIVYDGPSELIVTLDEALMYRVLINLIDNAIKYSPQEGTIILRAGLCEKSEVTPREDAVTQSLYIDILDEGSGFRESDLPYIFNRFYRADPSRSRTSISLELDLPDPKKPQGRSPNSGSGLGLAIVQQIVEAHRGTIQARNHPETGGGWLTISIPVKSPALEEATLPKGTA